MISIEELSKRKLTKKGQNRATANHILQKVIEKFVELREEHKKAKDDFLKRELKYSILIEKLKDMKPEDVEEFTGDRIYRALKEHETKREVRPFYTITEEQLKNEVEPELMRRLDEILGEIKKIAEADDWAEHGLLPKIVSFIDRSSELGSYFELKNFAELLVNVPEKVWQAW